MRILSVITRLNIGGASPMVLSLSTGLRRFGHETMLAVGTPEPGEGTLEREAVADGVALVRIPSLRRNPHPIRDVHALVTLVRLIRRWRPALIATHLSKAGALGRLAGLLTGVPVVHTYHGKGFHVFDSAWKTQLTLNAERALARLTAGVIVVSGIQDREFSTLGVGDASRRRVIHYGLQLAPFIEGRRHGSSLQLELGLRADVRLVGVIGRVVDIKGQDVFIRAAGRLSDQYPDVRFIIVGDGDGRPRFEALVKELGIAHAVMFLGWRRDIPQLLSSMDVVVLPTVLDFEGVPVTVIEALAAARPVVATAVGGVAEVIRDGETGRLVPPRDDEALARGIQAMLDDPDGASTMGRRGQELAKSMFQIDRYLKDTDAFFREIVSTRSPEAAGVASPARS